MKQTVHFLINPKNYIVVGKSAMVFPIDHTSPWVSNQMFVHTSTVISVNPDGSFETNNSLYVPVNGETV